MGPAVAAGGAAHGPKALSLFRRLYRQEGVLSAESCYCDQFNLLSDEAYAAGLRRIEAALEAAEAAGEQLIFPVDISIGMLTGWVHHPNKS